MRLISFDVGIVNLALCEIIFDDKDGPVTLDRFEILDISTPNTKKHELSLVTQRLLTKLRDLFWSCSETKRIDFVLIENQPVQKNPVMKSVQMVIYTFFNVMKMMCDGSVGEVRLVSASNKLKLTQFIKCKTLCSSIIEDAKVSAKVEKGYKYNKKLAVGLLNHFLQTIDEVQNGADFKDVLTRKKVDDLADTFLQGLWFIRTGSWV